jgi:hypothetical protein
VSPKTQPPEIRLRTMHAIDGPWDVRFERAAASYLFAKRSPRVWLVEVQAVNISAARFYCLH